MPSISFHSRIYQSILTIVLLWVILSGCGACGFIQQRNDFSTNSHSFSPSNSQAILKKKASTSMESLHKPKPWTTNNPPSFNEVKMAVKNNTVNEKIEELGNWWLYGPGIGRTALNVGTTVLFPPYGLYLLTNAGLSLAGYAPLQPTKLLPEEASTIIEKSYDEITSVPGLLTSGVAGVPFHSKLPSTTPTNISAKEMGL